MSSDWLSQLTRVLLLAVTTHPCPLIGLSLTPCTGHIADTLIAWEWFTCLSPHGDEAGQLWANRSARNYEEYFNNITHNDTISD